MPLAHISIQKVAIGRNSTEVFIQLKRNATFITISFNTCNPYPCEGGMAVDRSLMPWASE